MLSSTAIVAFLLVSAFQNGSVSTSAIVFTESKFESLDQCIEKGKEAANSAPAVPILADVTVYCVEYNEQGVATDLRKYTRDESTVEKAPE